MNKILSAVIVLLLCGSTSFAQTGVRIFGAQQFQLDDNINGNPKGYLSLNLGSIGIDGTGIVSGSFPNTSTLVTLLAGTKTTNLRVDGGSTWGIDVVNTNNSMRTSGRSIFGDGVGVDDATFNLGSGNITIVTLPSPVLPSPLANVLYMNGSNQLQMTPGGINIVTGSGTTNKLPLWTPNGNQLGNSYLTQSTNVAGGSLTSSERTIVNSTIVGVNTLTVNNADATSTGLKINANGGTGINVDPAATGIKIDATTLGMDLGTGATKPTTGINVNAFQLGANYTVAGSPTSGNTGVAVSVSGANGSGNVGFQATLTPGLGSGPNNRGLQLIISGSGPIGVSGAITNTTGVNTTGGSSYLVQGFGNANTFGYDASVNGNGGGIATGFSSFISGGATNFGVNVNVTGTTSTGLNIAGPPSTGAAILANFLGESIGVNGSSTGNTGLSMTVDNAGHGGGSNVGEAITVGHFPDGTGPSHNIGMTIDAEGFGATGIQGNIIGSTINPSFGESWSVTGAGGNISGYTALMNGAGGGICRGLWVFNNNAGGATNVGAEFTMAGANSIGININGTPTTAVTVTSGNIVLGSTLNTIASGGTIPNGQAVVDVNNNGVAASVATVTLPAGATNGQVIYVTTEDPDGVKITVGLASVTISNAEVGRFMFINGTWRLEH